MRQVVRALFGLSASVLICLSLSGSAAAFQTLWTRQMGASGWDVATGVAVDPAGNAYVVGYTMGGLDGNTNAGLLDMFIVKYSPSGVKLWTRQTGTTQSDRATCVSVDSAGNAYVGGYSFDGKPDARSVSTEGYPDIFVIKYDTNGNKLWTRQIGTADFDEAYGISVDSDGDAYIVGYTDGNLDGNTNASGSPGIRSDFFVAKYDTNGNKLWTKQMGTTGSDRATAVSVDSAGNAYVVGNTNGNLVGITNADPNSVLWGPYSDIFIVKYDPNGNRLWTSQTGSTDDDWAKGVSVDTAGNAYVVGYTEGVLDGSTSAGGRDIFIVKYDTNGNKLWIRQTGTSLQDYAEGVSVDFTGSVYMAGFTNGGLDGNVNQDLTGNTTDLFVVKYDTNGNKIWTRQKGTQGADGAYGVCVGPAGNSVYVAGSAGGGLDGNSNLSGYETFAMKLDTAPPTCVSVAPSGGNVQTESTQTFTATYSDLSGATAISGAYMLINTTNAGAGGAYVYYNRSAGRLYLMYDTNTSWGAGSVLGAGGTTLTNSQCSVVCATSGAATTGNNLTLTLKMAFGRSFIGARKVYMYATDITGLNSAWVYKGALNVQLPTAPTTGSVSPASGTAPNGVTQTYTATYSDGNGATDIKSAFLLINNSVSSAGAVYIYYDRAANRLYLRDSANASWGAGSVVGAGGTTLTNTRCSVACATSGSAASGNNLTLTLKVTFNAAFAGAKNIYEYVTDNGGLTAGWAAKGTVTVN